MKFARTATVLSAAGLLLAGGTIGYAAIPSSDGSVKLCYAKAGSFTGAKGSARVVDQGESCKATELGTTVASAAALAQLRAQLQEQDARIARLESLAPGLSVSTSPAPDAQTQTFFVTVKGQGLKPATAVTQSYSGVRGSSFGYADDAGNFFKVRELSCVDYRDLKFATVLASGDSSETATIAKGPGCL